jgi:hypothetical protein
MTRFRCHGSLVGGPGVGTGAGSNCTRHLRFRRRSQTWQRLVLTPLEEGQGAKNVVRREWRRHKNGFRTLPSHPFSSSSSAPPFFLRSIAHPEALSLDHSPSTSSCISASQTAVHRSTGRLRVPIPIPGSPGHLGLSHDLTRDDRVCDTPGLSCSCVPCLVLFRVPALGGQTPRPVITKGSPGSRGIFRGRQ